MLLLHTQIRSRDTAVFGQALGVMDVPKNMFKLVDSEKILSTLWRNGRVTNNQTRPSLLLAKLMTRQTQLTIQRHSRCSPKRLETAS